MKHEKTLLKKPNCLLDRYPELVIFAFLLFKFLIITKERNVDSITTTYYLISYEFGFVSRAFIGSVFSLFTDYITNHMLYIVSIVMLLLLIAFISILLGGIIRRSSINLKNPILLFILLFLASPLSVTYLLGFHFGRLDLYWLLLTLLALVFMKKPVLRWFVPLICAIALCVHQGYMDTYMPALAIPLLYEVYKSNYSKKLIVIFSLSCITMIALFVYFQFFPSSIPFGNEIDFANHLSARADFDASLVMIHLEYFAEFPKQYIGYVWPVTASFALPLGAVLLAFSLPLIIVFGYLWKLSLKSTDKKFLKFIFYLCALAPLMFIPAAIVANDWDRWWAACINSQFILVFYFIYSKEKPLADSLEKIGNFFEKHLLLLISIVVFTNSLTFSTAAAEMFSFVQNREATAKLIENYFNSVL